MSSKEIIKCCIQGWALIEHEILHTCQKNAIELLLIDALFN